MSPWISAAKRRLRNRCEGNQCRSYFLWTTTIKFAMLSLENYGLLSVFVRRTNLFCLQHLQNASFPDINMNQIGWHYTFYHLGSLLFFMKMIANFKTSPVATSWETTMTTRKNLQPILIFSPETNLKNLAPNRNQVQSWDSRYGDHSSQKQPRKFIFTQP